MSHLQLYKSLENNFEIGIDEAGRGPMFGRLYVAAVVLPKDGTFFHKDIKDSKKIKSVKKMKECFEYITQNSLYYAIHYIDHNVIDNPEKIHLLVDGNDFKPYIIYDEKLQYFKTLSHETVEGGDNTYMSIAAASILAKYSRDQYIIDLCEKYPDLKSKYSIHTNMGYGTQKHLEGINSHGISQWHRTTYGSCKGKALHIVYSTDS
jgi:ribonuclease HII